jgi:hypothetical protein
LESYSFLDRGVAQAPGNAACIHADRAKMDEPILRIIQMPEAPIRTLIAAHVIQDASGAPAVN